MTVHRVFMGQSRLRGACKARMAECSCKFVSALDIARHSRTISVETISTGASGRHSALSTCEEEMGRSAALRIGNSGVLYVVSAFVSDKLCMKLSDFRYNSKVLSVFSSKVLRAIAHWYLLIIVDLVVLLL